MLSFNHLGIFVKKLHYGLEMISRFIPLESVEEPILDHNLSVSVQFVVDKSNLRYELVAPLGQNNPVDPVLKSRKNILNHIAYASNQFDDDYVKLRNSGCIPISAVCPAVAFDNKRVVFFLTPLGVIYELIEADS